MNRLRYARIACIASMVWSALFICIELAIGAGIYAVAQAILLMASAALLRLHTRLIARHEVELPLPKTSTDNRVNSDNY